MVELAVAAVPIYLKNPFTLAHGSSDYRTNVFLRLRYDGLEAWGEAPVVPYYPASKTMIIEDLKENITTKALKREESPLIWSASCHALDSALLSLEVQKSGRGEDEILDIEEPIWDVPTSFTIAYDGDIERSLDVIEQSGFTTLKIKGGFSDDGSRIEAIRRKFPDHTIYVDANGGWNFEEALRNLDHFVDLGVTLVEEPITGSIEQIRTLRNYTAIPILLDETIQTESDLRQYATAISGVVIKLAKSGGPFKARVLIQTALDLNLDVLLSCMVESSIGITAALPLRSLCRYLDLDGPLLLQNDMGTPVRYLDDRPLGRIADLKPSEELRAHFKDAYTWEIPL